MQQADTLIRTKLHLPFTRLELVSRLRLMARIEEGLRGPLTLVTTPAGFGKTTLVAALQEADHAIGSEVAQLLATARQAPLEAILTSLINDLDTTSDEIVLVLDDYQFISRHCRVGNFVIDTSS